ncbi:MAG TPA: SpoIVB peptidase S55 domain-containing protein [Candidatus Polarisedimenticolia bacterium]|nr:SpoIVB peptidase S55 domain-containing protein [Candidatus Polarisedimenticolia bacterium]
MRHDVPARAGSPARAIQALRSLLPAAALLTAWLPLAAAPSAAPPIMPFKDVAAGMKGVGRTVFRGTAVEEFSVEIVGTMANVLPKKNLILARLEGGPLRETGIMEGMSGSPVYIDGRLIGAVAYSWGFAKEPICGITPIEEMLALFDKGLDLPEGTSRAAVPARGGEPAPVSLLSYPDRMVAFLKQRQGRLLSPAPMAGAFQPMRPTLVFSGYTPQVAREWFPAFEAMSLRPVMSGAPSAAASAGAAEARESPFGPGSAFGVTLVRGDLDITAVGTVTYQDGDKVLGFGHPMLGMGATAMPMTKAYVYGYFPSLLSSFKLASPAGEIGAIVQDRFPGIAGRKGASVRMVPVRVEIKRPNGAAKSFRFDIVPDPLLTPGLLHVSLLSLLSAEEKNVGEITLRMREGSRIQVTEGLDVKLNNLFSGDLSTLYASGTVAYMTYLLLNNEDRPSQIEGINLLLDYEDERRIARVEKIWLERYTARPGETLQLHVDLQPYREERMTVDIPLKIPDEAPEGKVLLQVGDSLTLSRMESVGGGPYFAPRSLEHLVWLLNHIRSNHKLYATIIRPDTGALISGLRLPNLPPSISSVLLQPQTGLDATERARFRAVLEADAETAHVVRGYQKALLEIRR